jgi:hypothetical protein
VGVVPRAGVHSTELHTHGSLEPAVLGLRPNCELCDVDLPPDAAHARICSYECTFCASCVDRTLENVCPNCGGGFVPRPIRPRSAWRPTAGLVHDPPDTRRRRMSYSHDEVAALVRTLRSVPPSAR